jgi:hypothetical protein
VMRNFRSRRCPSYMPRKSIHISAAGQNFLSSYLQFTDDMMLPRDNMPAQTARRLAFTPTPIGLPRETV